MYVKNKGRIGVWGYGIVGKAISRYFHEQGYHINVMDKRMLRLDEIQELQQKNMCLFHENNKNDFFNFSDYIFSSPGINIVDDYATHKYKWITELDFFAAYIQKPIIAVTGSIGKTSVTHMLAALLKLAHISACVGGNIGVAMFNLLAQKDIIDYALLEVSSFQLHHCTTFAPQLALWTNIHPNHLDHHRDEKEYFLAKYNIMAYQQPHQHAVLHLSLRSRLPHATIQQQRSYITRHKPDNSIFTALHQNERMYYLDRHNTVIHYHRNTETPIVTLNDALLHFSFIENTIMLAAAANILQISPLLMLQLPDVIQLPEHRLEKVATINAVDFYNDSKSTTVASTLAAVEKLKHRPLHLFLGGLSKGVNREPFIAQLKAITKHIYCFGKEAQELHAFCIQNAVASTPLIDLTTAFYACIKNIQPGDIVLLSPAGSSYDLYDNFEERGMHFKNLVKKMTEF